MKGQEKFYSDILVLEDDSQTSRRVYHVGISDGAPAPITLRVHRFNGSSPAVVGKKKYQPGTIGRARNGRINLAVQLLERTQPGNCSVVVTGTSYGGTGSFLAMLSDRKWPFVVQVRPSTLVDVLSKSGNRLKAAEMLPKGNWRKVSTSLPDGTMIEYSAAKLADVRLPAGTGTLFAARIGGIEGAQRSTIIGLSSFEADISELLRLVG